MFQQLAADDAAANANGQSHGGGDDSQGDGPSSRAAHGAGGSIHKVLLSHFALLSRVAVLRRGPGSDDFLGHVGVLLGEVVLEHLDQLAR